MGMKLNNLNFNKNIIENILLDKIDIISKIQL